MNNLLVLLDKDGTLVQSKSGNTFVQSPEDQELLPNVKERIAELVALNATIVVVSNQGGVSAGFKTLENTVLEFDYLLTLLPEIKTVYFCPCSQGLYAYSYEGKAEKFRKHTRSDMDYRKPEPGMLITAIRYHYRPEQFQNVIMIGDRPEDEGAAKNADVRFQCAYAWRSKGLESL